MRDLQVLDVKGHERIRLIMDGTLKIEKVTEEDVGLYTCTVTGPSNRPGTKTAEALLSVYCECAR